MIAAHRILTHSGLQDARKAAGSGQLGDELAGEQATAAKQSTCEMSGSVEQKE